MPVGPFDWDIHYLGVLGGLFGLICANFINLAPKQQFWSSSGSLDPIFSPDMPQKTPNNECPNQVAQLEPFGMLWGNKKAQIGHLVQQMT